MTAERQRLTRLILILAGVLAVHSLGYLIAHPDPLVRAAALDGHGYLELATALILPALAVALGAMGVRRARELEVDIDPRRLSVSVAATFSALEILERIPAGVVEEVLREPAVAVGLALVLPVSLVLAWLARSAGRIAEVWLARKRAPIPRPRPAASFSARPRVNSPLPVPLTSVNRRGPPLLVLT